MNNEFNKQFFITKGFTGEYFIFATRQIGCDMPFIENYTPPPVWRPHQWLYLCRYFSGFHFHIFNIYWWLPLNTSWFLNEILIKIYLYMNIGVISCSSKLAVIALGTEDLLLLSWSSGDLLLWRANVDARDIHTFNLDDAWLWM